MAENAMTDRPQASNSLLPGVYAAGRSLRCGNWIWSWTPRAWSLAVRAACPHCGRSGW